MVLLSTCLTVVALQCLSAQVMDGHKVHCCVISSSANHVSAVPLNSEIVNTTSVSSAVAGTYLDL